MTETIALFGATGMTGRYIITLALEQGYKIKALARTPSKVQTEHENLSVIEGDFSNTEAVKETVTGADYVICCAGGAFKPKEYPKDMMLNFVSILVPMIMAEPSVKVFLYQAGAFSMTPDGKETPSMKETRLIAESKFGIGPNISDNDEVIRYLDKNMSGSCKVIVTRPGKMQDDPDDGTKLVASDTPDASPITFKSLAAFSLDAIKDKSLYGKYPYCVPASA